MNQPHELDKVIRCLNPKWLPSHLNADERIVIFDAQVGKVLPKVPFISRGKDIRCYFVAFRRESGRCKGPTCKIKSLATRLSLDVDVWYEPRCEKGNEEKLAAAVARGADPVTVVDQFIAERIQDFVAAESAAARDVCLGFPQLQGVLQAYVAERARNELGLTLELSITPRLEGRIEQIIPIRTDYFPVRVSDHDEELGLRLSTELSIDPEHAMRALLYHGQMINPEELVRQVLRQVLAEEVTLHAFTYELMTEVRSRLIETLNARLWEQGRKVTHLKLESPAVRDQFRGIPEIEHTVGCKIADCDDLILVTHRLHLSLRDLGRFRVAGIQDLENWATARLEEITKDVLFERRYRNLLDDFNPLVLEIKARMEREVERIGHTVKQLVTAPDLEPLRWRDGFLLDDIEGTFGTRDSRIDVRLKIVVKGKIVDLRNPRLQKYLVPRSRLFDDIKEVVLRETRQRIHAVSAEHFYMRFAYSDDPEQPAVRETLETAIAAVLAERFAVEDIGVIPKPLETDLTKRLERLCQGPHKLEVACTPLNRGGEEVKYRIDFDVLGVPPEGWYVFRAKSYASPEEELDKVREVIAEDVKSKLQVAPREILQFTDLGRYHDLSQVIQRSVRDKVERVFGLRIQIINMNRLATYGETRRKEVTEHAIDASMKTGIAIASSKQADLEMLYEMRQDMIHEELDRDDPKLAEVERRIEHLERELSPDQFARGQQEVKALLPGRSGNSRSEEWKRLALGEEPAQPPSEPARLAEPAEEEAS